MRTRGGIFVIGAAVLVAISTGCAATPSAPPTSMAVGEPSFAPTESAEVSAEEAEAQQRAETWLETTPVPPGAVRSEKRPSEIFAMSYYGWVCTPTMTETGYWTVDGMAPGEALNWMLDNPTPGLVPWRSQPIAVESVDQSASAGVTPAGEALQGIAFTYVQTPTGSAIRAEVGATPVDAICPTPDGGGTWGRPGEG